MTSAHHLALRTENVYIRMQSTFSFFSSFFFSSFAARKLTRRQTQLFTGGTQRGNAPDCVIKALGARASSDGPDAHKNWKLLPICILFPFFFLAHYLNWR